MPTQLSPESHRHQSPPSLRAELFEVCISLWRKCFDRYRPETWWAHSSAFRSRRSREPGPHCRANFMVQRAFTLCKKVGTLSRSCPPAPEHLDVEYSMA